MRRITCLALALMLVFSISTSLAENADMDMYRIHYAQLLAGEWQAEDGSDQITIEKDDIFFSETGDAYLRQGTDFRKLLLNADKNTFCLIDEHNNTSDMKFYTRCDEISKATDALPYSPDGYTFRQLFEKCAPSVV